MDPLVARIQERVHAFNMGQIEQAERMQNGERRTDRGYRPELLALAQDVIQMVREDNHA